MSIKADSLAFKLKQYEKFTAVLKPVIKGEIPPDELSNPLSEYTDYAVISSTDNDSIQNEIGEKLRSITIVFTSLIMQIR